ncbi:hypothetical protein ACOI22_03450 [Glaciecola sp. 2405UD65-10]|uniref:hypothetical protein n=1 Tax=Glaciecola sp. 2405UD65-10 TaxID=3397244 RepID=UPI003B5AD13D
MIKNLCRFFIAGVQTAITLALASLLVFLFGVALMEIGILRPVLYTLSISALIILIGFLTLELKESKKEVLKGLNIWNL